MDDDESEMSQKKKWKRIPTRLVPADVIARLDAAVPQSHYGQKLAFIYETTTIWKFSYDHSSWSRTTI